MDAVLIGLGGAILGALVTWALTYYLPSRDARRLADAQERIAQIEEERNEWETRYRKLSGFSPAVRITGRAPEHQYVEVEADEPFTVLQLDYCIGTGARVTSEEFREAEPSRHAKVLIDRPRLEHLHRAKYDGRTGAADVSFRLVLRVLGAQREVTFPARIENVPVGNTYYRNLIG